MRINLRILFTGTIAALPAYPEHFKSMNSVPSDLFLEVYTCWSEQNFAWLDTYKQLLFECHLIRYAIHPKKKKVWGGGSAWCSGILGS